MNTNTAHEVPSETCADCAFCHGPLIPWCGNPKSEFYRNPVFLDGYCFEFTRPVDPPLDV